MELGRFRDLSRIYALIMGAFSVVFFVQGVMIGFYSGGPAVAFICSAALFIVLIFGFLVLWFGLEKWDRFYTDMTVPVPYYRYPYYPMVYQYPPAPYYYQAPANYPPPVYQYPGAPYYPAPPATQAPPAPASPPQYPNPYTYQAPPPMYQAPAQPAYGYPRPVYQAQPPAYQPPTQPAFGYPQPVYRAPPPAYQPPARPAYWYPQPVYQNPPPATQPPAQPAYGYFQPAYVAPLQPAVREVDPRRPLILPQANRLLGVFLASIIIGGLSLALSPFTGNLTLLVFLPAFIIGFSFPSLIWISYVYSFEKRHILPSKAVLTALVYGMLSTIPALIVNTVAEAVYGIGPGASLTALLITAAVIAPLVEEFCKPWGLYIVRGEVRGPLDGLIIGVTCGVGFAIIENVTYELSFVFTGQSAAAVWTVGSLARGLGSIMVHATGAGMIGYAYGRYRAGGDALLVPLAYLAGVGLHSLWNGSSTLFDTVSWGTAGTIGFMIVFALCTFLLLNHLIRTGGDAEAATGMHHAPPLLPQG